MWIAGGNKSGHPNKNELACLEKIVPAFCSEKQKQSNLAFSLDEFDSFIKRSFPQVRPHRSRMPKSEVKEKFPNKTPLDTQNSCYHLSDKNQREFHTKCEVCNKRIQPFQWIDDISYSLKPDWVGRLCNCVGLG